MRQMKTEEICNIQAAFHFVLYQSVSIFMLLKFVVLQITSEVMHKTKTFKIEYDKSTAELSVEPNLVSWWHLA